MAQRRAMVERDGRVISLREQARLLSISRSSLYYKRTRPSKDDLGVKRLIDEVYTEHPEFGYRRVREWLDREHCIGLSCKTIRRHMREMGIRAVYPAPNTSKSAPGHRVYPYLLKGLDITRPLQVWGIDITYIPIRGSWLYLVAIIDWYSRYIVSWRVSETLEIDFVLDAVREAYSVATPEIMNSDQGSHFTSPRFTELIHAFGSRISMDHRGRAFDNIISERFWRTVKYEDVYLREYASPREARQGLARFIRWYNSERPHQSLGYRTPEEVHLGKNAASTPSLRQIGEADDERCME